ncbi:MAG: aminopeptidase P family protein [Bacteroidales bacterium]|jgi:Xaa-Pro aminopeptidase|nr:aminopeptidase P family protein [Bacteroidales bacterium]
MFTPDTYQKRREALRKILSSGIIFFPGNTEVPFNYPSNTYSFRQDSSFLYFFGLNEPDLAAVIDLDNGSDYLFGNDSTMDDIIWMGEQPSMKDKAASAGVHHFKSYNVLAETLQQAQKQGRRIHFLPPYRAENKILLLDILGIPPSEQKEKASVELIKAVVQLRSVKEDQEIGQIEQAIGTAYKMHTHIMKNARAGMVEMELSGAIEGIALMGGGPVSFPVILSVNGQTLHNHYHGNTMQDGQMLLTDAGCETGMGYASDITRTVPVSGKFDERQKVIYNTVLQANLKAIEMCRPGILYRDVHLAAARVITEGLKEAGVMKGNTDDAVAQGAHALFFPHGLGHMMGLDVHDMENLGENYVGYDDEVVRSTQFGFKSLRMGRRLQPGFVVTDEPGTYFIPALIDQWEGEKKFTDYIRYDALKAYRNFGGIRIEDNILVTETGCRVLSNKIPKTIEEIEGIRYS